MKNMGCRCFSKPTHDGGNMRTQILRRGRDYAARSGGASSHFARLPDWELISHHCAPPNVGATHPQRCDGEPAARTVLAAGLTHRHGKEISTPPQMTAGFDALL